jgi:hypothetical protein
MFFFWFQLKQLHFACILLYGFDKAAPITKGKQCAYGAIAWPIIVVARHGRHMIREMGLLKPISQ